MVDVSGVVAPTGAFGWVYDPTRDVIHIVTTAGVLTDYSLATKANVFSQNLGGTPNDVEISQDGRFLLVGNSALTGGQATVTRVDLATHGLSTINVPVVSTSTPATGSLAVGYDGTAYVGLRGGGSFDNPFRSFAVDAVIPITSPVSLAPSFYSSAEVLSSEDHRYLLLQDLGISSGPLRLYDSVAGLTVASTDLYALNTSGYQAGRGDVSSAAHLVVDMWYTGLLVLDLNLHLVQDLSSQQRAGSVIGVAFNEGGHQLFLWKGEDKTVLVLDTQSWRQVGSLAVTTSASFGSNSPYGAMDVTAGGRALILDADTRLEILDLTRMSLTVGGDATSQALYGAIGPDQISAAGGADTLAGGGGRDTLSGGADGDLFLFAPGDSAAVDGESDVIIDWEASDRLTFGGAAGTAVNYVEGAAGSFGAALSFAGSQIAGGAADYVAVQVGADVVVFADSRNDNGAADEAVVLRGRGLADIAASNIAAGPPPPPPAFQLGGAGNDTLVAGAAEQLLAGGDGDDLLVGGAAANTLNGGAGLDTVSYASATGPVRLNLATSAVQNVGSGHGSDIIIQVERLIGGAFGDSLTGTAGTDTLVGGDGGDSVLGGGGVDLLTGDGGDDTLSGGGTLSGGAGRDVLQGGAGADVLGGGEGDDSIAGGGGVDLLAGDGGADTLAGSGTLTGGAGLDVLTSTLAGTIVQGGDDADRISGAGGTWLGEGGDDTLTVTSGAGSLDGGSGADSLTGSAGADSLAGQDGDDVARGGGGADTLSGGAGADTLAGGTGRDLISGGAGADRIEIAVGDSVAAGGFDAIDVIQDWDATDSLVFAGGGVRGSAYFETSAADYALAYFNANLKIQTGQANFVAVQVGSDVVVFADSNNDNGTADSAVVLAGRGLADIDEANFVAAPPEATVAPPPPVLRGPFSASGRVVGDMDAAHIGALLGAEIDAFDSELLLIGRSASADVVGTGFTYDSNEQITGGSVRGVALLLGAFQANITIPAGVSAVSFGRWVATDATQEAFATVLAGADSLIGGSGAELLRGYGGGDLLAGNGGADTIYGGLGDDVIYALAPGVTGGSSPPGTYLRGDEGDDYILGGSGFDDANGNMGNDTVSTGAGDDYCVGGKDNDVLFGDAGADLVYGNLGNDTCEGGDGNDIVRGGQDNDSCVGGAGDDFVSGDKGDDTMTGGAGADIFHTFGDAGLDRVTDFSLAQGDRVMLDPGTVFTVSQVGADTVINMTGGGQMILVGVSMGTLTPGWIFGG